MGRQGANQNRCGLGLQALKRDVGDKGLTESMQMGLSRSRKKCSITSLMAEDTSRLSLGCAIRWMLESRFYVYAV